jgi:hypothetical protein
MLIFKYIMKLVTICIYIETVVQFFIIRMLWVHINCGAILIYMFKSYSYFILHIWLILRMYIHISMILVHVYVYILYFNIT